MENGDSKDHYFYTSKLEKLKQVSLNSITYLDSREFIFMKVLHENVLPKHACFTQKLEICFPIGSKYQIFLNSQPQPLGVLSDTKPSIH